MDKRLTKRFNLQKSIGTELEEIKNIIHSAESEAVKMESIRAILTDLADEIVEARSEKLYEDRTGFLGPKFGEDFLAKEIEVCRRYGKNFTIGLLDIDFLKYINDHFGHVEGTKAIMTTAEAIKEGVRSADVVSRYGGDEFLIIFTDTNLNDATIAVNRIREILDKLNKTAAFKIAISFGLAEFDCSKDSVTALNLIEQADKQLYRAKKNRGNPNLK